MPLLNLSFCFQSFHPSKPFHHARGEKKRGTMLWVESNELPSALKSEFRAFSLYELALTASKELNEIHLARLVWRLLSHNLQKKKSPLICYGFKEGRTAAGRGCWRGSKRGKAWWSFFVTDWQGMTLCPSLTDVSRLDKTAHRNTEWPGKDWSHPVNSWVPSNVVLKCHSWHRLCGGSALPSPSQTGQRRNERLQCRDRFLL